MSQRPTHPDRKRDEEADEDVARVGHVEAQVPPQDDREFVPPRDGRGVAGAVLCVWEFVCDVTARWLTV